MKTKLKYVKRAKAVEFKDIPCGTRFYGGNVLYIKISQADLDSYGINNVNAVSFLNGGLTKFEPDESVNEAVEYI